MLLDIPRACAVMYCINSVHFRDGIVLRIGHQQQIKITIILIIDSDYLLA